MRNAKGVRRLIRAAQNGNASTPEKTAEIAGLRYVSDNSPGIHRRKKGSGFVYWNGDGRAIRDKQTLERVRGLVIPPAWTDVWICRFENGHIQAVGRDQRKRKQYIYHPRWREVRDGSKYGKMIAFAKALPKIRARVSRDLRKRYMVREKVLAAVVHLLEATLIRVGNDEYAKENKSFGLTTIRNHHARVRGESIHFKFKGKSGVLHEVCLEDPRIARIVRKCQDLPGQELFAYVDDEGNVHDVTSDDVNQYLHEISAEDYTAKDFRTWAGTCLAARTLREMEPFDSPTGAKRNIVEAIKTVASRLRNTRAVCRKCYIHPSVLEGYMKGTLQKTLEIKRGEKRDKRHQFTDDEFAVLGFLKGVV